MRIAKTIRSIGILMAMGFWLFPAARTFAQDIRVDVELSSKRIPLGSTAKLVITVNGSQDVNPIQLPKVDGLDAQYLGPSTRVSIVNGEYSNSKAFTYSLLPRKIGQFKIPAFDVLIAGKIYRMDPISFEVVEAGGPSGQSPGGSSGGSLEDKIFLVLKVPKTEIYLNERIPIQVILYVADLSVTDVQFPQFDNIGFSIEEYEKPRQYQQVVDNIRYGVVEFNTDIYPTRTGELTLGPARTDCNLVVQGSRRRSPFGGGSLFDDSFFDSFFGGQEKRPFSLESGSKTIKVLPLPEEGKPQDFSGAVGQFDFNVSVSPAEVKEGDPITLRMTVIGRGNLTAFDMPSLSSKEDFKLYDPQIFEKDNIKKSEQVIIPNSAEVTQVPEIRFSYFDPEQKKYRTVRRGPFPITVTKLKKGEEFKVVGLEGTRSLEAEQLGEDIVFIKTKPGTFHVIGTTILTNPFFYIGLLVLFGLWLGAVLYYRWTYRIQTDVVYARRLQAPRQAKQGLAQAKKFIAAQKGEEFYDTVFKTMVQYLGNKLHLPFGAVTFETVRSHLGRKDVEAKIIDDIRTTYEECDMIRYASAGVSQQDMHASYERLTHIIDYLERSLK